MIVKLARLDAFIMKNHWNIFQLKILLWLLHNAYVGNMTVQLHMFQLQTFQPRLYNSKTFQPQDLITPRLYNS